MAGKLSVTRMQKLPPIREETFSGQTPAPPQIQYEVRPRAANPDLNKPKVHVRPLPADKKPKEKFVVPRNRSRFEEDPKPLIPVYDKPVLTYDRPLSPIDTTNTLVDGVVADYLHYAKYGHVIPIYEGSGSLTCPCCTDRNRENVRTLLGFPNVEDDVRKEAWRTPRGDNPGSYLQTTARTYNPGPRVQTAVHAYDPRKSWLHTQPLPYATNYLNPEFNRPSSLYNYWHDQRNEEQNRYVNSEVLTASNQFEQSMKRLEKYGKDRKKSVYLK